MKIKFILLLVVAAISVSQPNITQAQVDVQDSLALVDLYNSTDGPNWHHQDNWLTSVPVKNWYGINIFGNRVSTINLRDNNLKGSIPPELGNLGNLRRLDLSKNQLSGSIPPQLGNLTNLFGLRLYNNHLSGSIPPELGKLPILRNLYLYNNQLSGSIPPELGNLNLINLNLSNNQLTGNIPSELGNLEKLDKLNLSHNQLSGRIPASLGSLKYLSKLYLNDNKLSGNIPLLLGNLTNLHYLGLDSNQLTGQIPSSLGNLKNLEVLKLNFNKLKDSMPSSLGNLTNLTSLGLSNNHLTGDISSSFSNLTKLHVLRVGFNNLSGTVPAFLSNMPELLILGLAHNFYTFDGMEDLVQQPFDTLVYARQKRIPIHQNNITLSVYAGGTLSNNTYKWFKDGALYATIAGDSIFQVTESGAYNVEVTNSIATKLTLLSDTVTYTAVIKQGFAASQLNSIDKTKTLSLYPNPAKTHSTFVFTATGKYTIEVTDMSGKILQTKTATAAKTHNAIELNVSSYAPGIYLVTVIDEQQRRSIKLKKEY